MKKIYLLSTCLKKESSKYGFLYHFHFRGIYLGIKINKIFLESKKILKERGDYFLLVEVISVDEDKLFGLIIKSKLID